ncbi:lipopolysaccharide kinase InaA family protein [Stutzerimonas azotifigens]|uniref:Phosphotransferase n=1 Tax=Stutzerimonas azotifigens TaxID=291995 RepID=A0ABR5YX29_9GAMM|nr:lipopolysaccharide kinase InaA family protein [Stutzerimonas azotifigens]MBA1272498.1 phosphotransferase [Stutzerimonas azotifigens]
MAQLIAAGAPARSTDVFDRWWSLQGAWVEAPNQRRGGESGVQRVQLRGSGEVLYLKRQHEHLYRSLTRPFGAPTALREQRALQALETLGVRVPRLVYCGARKEAGHWRALLITEALEGFIDLDQWYAEGMPEYVGPEAQQAMLRQLGATLARLHRGRWQHGCLYGKHVFVNARSFDRDGVVEVALLDLEKSRRRARVSTASRRDIEQLQRHRDGMPDADWACLLEHYRFHLARGSRP